MLLHIYGIQKVFIVLKVLAFFFLNNKHYSYRKCIHTPKYILKTNYNYDVTVRLMNNEEEVKEQSTGIEKDSKE